MRITEILNRYFEGETSIEEERTLKAYFAEGEVAEEHKIYADLFSCFKVESEITFEAEERIDLLLEKYFEGETSIEDEQRLKTYFNGEEVEEEHKQFAPLFNYYSEAQTEVLEKSLSIHKAKTLHIVRRSMMGIAAGLVILLASVFVMDNYQSQQQANALAISIEEAEAEEALETTMEALAFLGIKFNKGTESLDQLKKLQRADILKN
jgi:hypothetical protein